MSAHPLATQVAQQIMCSFFCSHPIFFPPPFCLPHIDTALLRLLPSRPSYLLLKVSAVISPIYYRLFQRFFQFVPASALHICQFTHTHSSIFLFKSHSQSALIKFIELNGRQSQTPHFVLHSASVVWLPQLMIRCQSQT